MNNFLQGSLEGIHFFMRPSKESQEHQHVVRKPINSDKISFQNFGLSGKGFDMSMLLISTDIINYQKNFIKILEKKTTLKMIHPYKGVLYLQCLRYEVQNSLQSGIRSVEVEATFLQVESVEEKFVKIVNISKTTKEFTYASSVSFDSIFSIVKKATYIQEDVARKMTDFQQLVTGTVRKVKNRVSSAIGRVSQINDQFTILLKTPEKIRQKAEEIIDQLYLLSEDVEETFSLQLALLTFGDYPNIDLTTKNREIQEDNRNSLISMLKDLSIASLSNQLSEYPFDSREEAERLRDKLLLYIDERIDNEVNFEVLSKLKQLKGELRYCVDRNENLAEIVEYTVPNTLPSLFLAYNLMDATFKEKDMLKRNTYIHPAFLGGKVRYKSVT